MKKTILLRYAAIFACVLPMRFAVRADVEVTRSALLSTTGSEYVTVRDAALALPAGEFEDLLDALNAADRVSEDRLIGCVLRLRQDQPQLALEFDQHLQHSIEHPRGGTASGKPKYEAWWPHDRFDVDPLAFEALVKLDLPHEGFSLRQSFLDFMSRKNPANIDWILLLAKREGVGFTCFLDDAAENEPDEQLRITPIIVQLHKVWRQEGQISSAAVHVLASFGNQLQLDALREIRTFEQLHLPTEGFSPWSETMEAVMDDSTAAIAAERQAKRAVQAAQQANQSPSVVNSLQASLQERTAEAQTASRRLYAKGMWDELEKAIAKLEAQLSPATQPQP